ncbi:MULTISPECIES: hypothetical protein [Deinococcus]|uniref:FlgO domain-containing protein n=1 Tax=Deinococcus cavernae TaxID=2320857 RepID=A0A418V7L3_9DEIO|nr:MULTISPECIES: hypothetical protein [Deinococcus]RJF72092.1 hypothetical protein D3875_11530 [Deinococcus cavernae]
MKYLPAFLLLSAGLAQAQDSTPITPQQFVKSEGIKQSYTVQQQQISPVDSLKMLMQCMAPATTPYDANADGQNDTLRVYGFGVVPAALYKAKGVMALSPAVQKADLKAMGAAAEALAGVRVRTVKGEGSVDSTATTFKNNELNLSNVAVETVFSATSSRSEALLRGGRVTGHRLVSLGEQGLCVVSRYELPLDQRAAAGSATRSPEIPGVTPSSQTQGFPLPAPGQTGDF